MAGMKPTNVEIEAKLVAPDAAALRQLPKALRAVCRSVRPLGACLIRDTYYDTPRWQLYHAGFACRVRREGGMTTLVLKSLKRPRGGVSVRAEYEQHVRPPIRAFLLRLEGPLGHKVMRLIGGERLRTIFTIRNRRHTFEARCEDGLTALVCADDFTVSSGGNSRRLAEIELEVVRGNRAQLQRLARALSARLELAGVSRAKYREGLEVGGHRPRKRF